LTKSATPTDFLRALAL